MLKINRTKVEGGTRVAILLETFLEAEQMHWLLKYGIDQIDECMVDVSRRRLVGTVETTIWD